MDRGLDLEKEDEGEEERGDNGIEIIRNWLMHEIQKDGKEIKNNPGRKDSGISGAECVL